MPPKPRPSISENQNTPPMSRGAVIAQMGAAKHNQKIITKSKIQRAQEYIKSMSSKFSSSSQTKEMPENIQMGQNDDEGSRCSSISASVKINFSKNVNDEERSSVSANVQINGSNTKNMNMNFILCDENLSEVEEEEENVTGKSAPAPDNMMMMIRCYICFV